MIKSKASNILDILNWATHELKGGSIINARAEAELIVSDAAGMDRAGLYLNSKQPVEPMQVSFVKSAVKDRLDGRPLQYILGYQQFRYLKLVCREEVLIPRPETELLVDEILVELKRSGGINKVRTVLDIGCGTGAIALSIAYEHPYADVYATDISETALRTTLENTSRNGLSGRVKVVRSDLFSELAELKNKVDILVSNPPYIPSADISKLQLEVQREPKLALDGGKDGVDFYRAIIREAPEYLKTDGMIFFETGINQAGLVAELLKFSGFGGIEIVRDYQGIERIVKARKLRG